MGLIEPGVAGAVICQNGKKHWCVYSDEKNEGIRYCIVMHERDHGDDVDCPPCDPNITRPPFKRGKDPDTEECNAFRVTLSCLQKEKPHTCNKLKGEARKACKEKFDRWIASMQEKIDELCK
jgi:hypothetical protein